MIVKFEPGSSKGIGARITNHIAWSPSMQTTWYFNGKAKKSNTCRIKKDGFITNKVVSDAISEGDSVFCKMTQYRYDHVTKLSNVIGFLEV